MRFYGNHFKKAIPIFNSIIFIDNKNDTIRTFYDNFKLTVTGQLHALFNAPKGLSIIHDKRERQIGVDNPPLISQVGQDISALKPSNSIPSDWQKNNTGVILKVVGADNNGHLHGETTDISINMKNGYNRMSEVDNTLQRNSTFIPKKYISQNLSICTIVDKILNEDFLDFLNNQISYVPDSPQFVTVVDDKILKITDVNHKMDYNEQFNPFRK